MSPCSFLVGPFGYWQAALRPPQSLLFSRLNSPNSLSLSQIPMQPVEKTMARQAVPLQPMNVRGGADRHPQPVEDPTPEQEDVPKRGCDPVESARWSRLLAGAVGP